MDASKPEFLVDRLLPVHQVHLIYGPLAEENTILALQLLRDWRAGEQVFGQDSHPLPACFIACNQNLERLHRFMRMLDIDPQAIPHLSLIPRGKYVSDESSVERNISTALDFARRREPDVRVLFIDGLGSLCSGRASDLRDVDTFLLGLLSLCQNEDLTIIGCVSSAKAREGEGYASPRDRIYGSTAWATNTDCKILVEPVRATRPDDSGRRIVIECQTRTARVLPYDRIENGGLVPRAGMIDSAGLDGWLATVPLGAEITTAAMADMGERLGVSKPTVERWLRDQVTLGILVKVKWGVYTRPNPN